MSDYFFNMNILILFINAFVSLFQYFVTVDFIWIFFACLIVLIIIRMILHYFWKGRQV